MQGPLDYLSVIWVVGRSGYSSYDEAKEYHPLKEPKQVIYRSKIWPAPYSPEGESGPVSFPKTKPPEESLRTILERTWESWERNNAPT